MTSHSNNGDPSFRCFSSGHEELLSPTDDPVVKCKWNDEDDDDDDEYRRRGENSSKFGAGAKPARGDLVIDSTKGRRKVHIEPEPEDDDDDNENGDGGGDDGEDRRHGAHVNGGRKRPTPIVPDGPRIIKLPKDPRPPAPLLDDTSLRDLESAKKALQVIGR